MTPENRSDLYLARRIRRAQPGGATAKNLAKLATPRVWAMVEALGHFKADCDAVADALALNLVDAPKGTVRQYVARRGNDYVLFNCNVANQTLSQKVVTVGEVPIDARDKADALQGQAFNQVQIFGPPYVWKLR